MEKVESTYQEYQGWDEWATKFKPKSNHFNNHAYDFMYETYGEEWDYIKSLDPRYVWTYVDGEMSSLIVAGVAWVNRLGYYVTEVPWENDMDTCLLSVEAECACYDEDRWEETGDAGDPDCGNCEGYGYVTNYL
jgi:hypothetical protein